MKAAITTIVVALALGGGGTFLWFYYGGFEGEGVEAVAFIETYGDYVEVAETVELLVNIPGVKNNADRAELLTLLDSILTANMTDEKRDSLARLAYTNLNTLEKEIDAAQSAQATLYEKLQQLDSVARRFNSIELQNRAMDIVSHARKRAEISARITSILSETNEQTHAIITRILADNGKLSQTHIIEINEATADAQARFDTLRMLYQELQQKKKEIDALFNTFVQKAL
jgi:uncharacterized secreted protein with C-terminal beta-propeller domain